MNELSTTGNNLIHGFHPSFLAHPCCWRWGGRPQSFTRCAICDTLLYNVSAYSKRAPGGFQACSTLLNRGARCAQAATKSRKSFIYATVLAAGTTCRAFAHSAPVEHVDFFLGSFFLFLSFPPFELPSPRPVRRLSFGPSFLFFLDGPLPPPPHRSPNPSPPFGPHEICPRGHEPRRGRDFSRAASGSSRRAVFIATVAPTSMLLQLLCILGSSISREQMYFVLKSTKNSPHNKVPRGQSI